MNLCFRSDYIALKPPWVKTPQSVYLHFAFPASTANRNCHRYIWPLKESPDPECRQLSTLKARQAIRGYSMGLPGMLAWRTALRIRCLFAIQPAKNCLSGQYHSRAIKQARGPPQRAFRLTTDPKGNIFLPENEDYQIQSVSHQGETNLASFVAVGIPDGISWLKYHRNPRKENNEQDAIVIAGNKERVVGPFSIRRQRKLWCDRRSPWAALPIILILKNQWQRLESKAGGPMYSGPNLSCRQSLAASRWMNMMSAHRSLYFNGRLAQKNG